MSIVISMVGCARLLTSAPEKEDLPDFLLPIQAASKLTLYSIDGRDHPPGTQLPEPAEVFHDYPVLGKVEIKPGEARSKILQELKRGTEPDPEHGIAKCFWPRHALRAEKDGKITDYVICFQCNWLKVYMNGKLKDIVIKQHPQELLNLYLREAGIQIAP